MNCKLCFDVIIELDHSITRQDYHNKEQFKSVLNINLIGIKNKYKQKGLIKINIFFNLLPNFAVFYILSLHYT